MNNQRLKQLGIVSLILLSLPALASTQHWVMNPQGGGYIDSSTDHTRLAVIWPDRLNIHNDLARKKDLVRIELLITSNKACDKRDSFSSHQTISWDVDGRLINFVYDRCQNYDVGFSAINFAPSTDEAASYIMDEFKRKAMITIAGEKYSGIGFLSTQNKVIAREEAKANTL